MFGSVYAGIDRSANDTCIAHTLATAFMAIGAAKDAFFGADRYESTMPLVLRFAPGFLSLASGGERSDNVSVNGRWRTVHRLSCADHT